MTIKSIGVALNTPTDENVVDATVAAARTAADVGVQSVWLGQRFDYDAITLAGFIGREIAELRVGTAAVPIFGRHPLLIAGQAQTVQAATHGRFELGVALGTKLFTEGAFGIPFDRPIARLREFLTATRDLVTLGTSDHAGELITATPPIDTTVPGAGTNLPLLVAAMGPQALRVSGELADGILPFLAGPRALADHIVPAVTRAAADAGRSGPRVIAFVAAVVTDDHEAGREAAASALGFYGQFPSYRRVVDLEGARHPGDLALIGSAAEIEAGVNRYFDAGATEVVLTQTNLLGEGAQRETWEVAGQLTQPAP